MIVYTCSSSTSDQKAIFWLDNHHIEYSKYKIKKISREDILRILALSDNGFDDLVKGKGTPDLIKKK